MVGSIFAAAADMRGCGSLALSVRHGNPLKVAMAAKRPDFQRLRKPKSAVTIVAGELP